MLFEAVAQAATGVSLATATASVQIVLNRSVPVTLAFPLTPAPTPTPKAAPSVGPIALHAINSPVASAGDTIYLEGSFGNTATVNFPGDTSADATVLGPGRAKVVVPPNATAGDLTVTAAGTTTAGLPFRAPTFSLGL